MARAANEANTQAKAHDEREAAAQPKPVGDGLRKIAEWIPSEALATYIAVLAVAIPKGSGARWGFFALGEFLVLLFAVGSLVLNRRQERAKWERKHKDDNRKLPEFDKSRGVLMVVFALVAFAIYGLALPASPVSTRGDGYQRTMGVLVVFSAAVMPYAAKLARIRPPDAS